MPQASIWAPIWRELALLDPDVPLIVFLSKLQIATWERAKITYKQQQL